MLTGRQIRMARAALQVRIDDVAAGTGIAWARLQHFERSNGPLVGDAATLSALRAYFEGNGIAFVDEAADYEAGIAVRRSAN